MARRGRAPKRNVAPDPVYNSRLVTKFINQTMHEGKKGLAQRIFYGAMARIQAQTGKDPLDVFEAAIKNSMPMLEVRPRRVGGATYQVPMEVRPERRRTLGVRWLVNACRNRGERTMIERLAAELMEAAEGSGAAVRRREEMHRMAEANKAFAHYRW
ncbi:MAG: 30S ribosomal protein S7 [Bacillota bacterium]